MTMSSSLMLSNSFRRLHAVFAQNFRALSSCESLSSKIHMRSTYKSMSLASQQMSIGDEIVRGNFPLVPGRWMTSSGTSDHVFASPFDPIPASAPINTENICTMVRKNWGQLGNHVAFIDAITNEKRTFSEVNRDVDVLTHKFYSMGVRKGDVVGMVSVNSVDYAAVVLSLLNLGAVVTPVNPSYTAPEIAKQLDDSDKTKVIVLHETSFDVGMESISMMKTKIQQDNILVIGEGGCPNQDIETLNNLRSYDSQDPSVVSDFIASHKVSAFGEDLAVLPYSSGTTGHPKGVMLCHRNITANLYQFDSSEGPSISPDVDVTLSPLPMFHIYSFLASMLYSAWRGMTLITMQRFDLKRFCETVEEHKVTRAHLVPPIVVGLVNHPMIDDHDLSSLRMIMCAAAPLGVELENACAARLGCGVKQAWGMSELSPLGTATADFKMKPGSGTIGNAASSTEIKIIDTATGETLPPNTPGELLVSGPQVMLGYLNEPEKTKETITPDGWLKTGDIAKIDDDGFCYITDRLKELIKYKGFQVAPAELEDVLFGHEAVADCIVIPRLDDEAGEVPRAYVILAQGYEPTDEMNETLLSFCNSKVANHKRLRGGIVFTDTIPKSASGKLLRRVLIEQDRA